MLLLDSLFVGGVLAGSFFVGLLLMIGLFFSLPIKLTDSEGLPPIFYIISYVLLVPFTLWCILGGVWLVAALVLLPACGAVAGAYACTRYAEYLDEVRTFLFTPQQPGKRKQEMPSYPKPEPMQEEPMAYYEEMSQRY